MNGWLYTERCTILVRTRQLGCELILILLQKFQTVGIVSKKSLSNVAVYLTQVIRYLVGLWYVGVPFVVDCVVVHDDYDNREATKRIKLFDA